MSRRNRLHPPEPAIVKPKPKPVAHTDSRGRVWTVVYLHKGHGRYGGTDNYWDATHRGFVCERHRLVYCFRSGDERGTDPETIAAQFTMAKRISTPEERAAREPLNTGPIPMPKSKEERMLDLFDGRRRGMGSR